MEAIAEEFEHYVIVPVGLDNDEDLGCIESIEYHPKDKAPYPIKKLKHIIRRFDIKKDKHFLQDEDE